MSEFIAAQVILARNVKHLLAPGPGATLGITAHGVLPFPPPGPDRAAQVAWLSGYKAAIADVLKHLDDIADVLKHLDDMPGQPEYRAAMEIYKGAKP